MSATLPLSAPAPASPAPRASAPVLLACDARASTDATATVARRVAARLHAPLAVVAALPASAAVVPMPAELPVLPPDFDAARRDDLIAAVRGRLTPVLGPPDSWPLEVDFGPAGDTICDAARRRSVALVVVGLGRRRRFDRLLGGGVPLDVVRHAPAPVLAVAPERAPSLRRAVVGVDFGAASVRAARAALSLLEANVVDPARLTLVHVTPWLPGPPARVLPHDAPDAATLLERVRALLRPDTPAGVVVETRVIGGTPAETLNAAADAAAADLVAVGTRGPGWVERLLVGSVASEVLRGAHTHVLVCPAPGADERLRVERALAGAGGA